MTPCSKEVIELHLFFQEWFRGDADLQNMSRMRDALHQEFIWISPWGTMHSKDELIDRVTPVHGTRPGMVIEIRNIKEIPLCDGITLVHYEEWQLHDQLNMGRISTAVFQIQAEAPNGVAWFHIQETMLPNPAP